MSKKCVKVGMEWKHINIKYYSKGGMEGLHSNGCRTMGWHRPLLGEILYLSNEFPSNLVNDIILRLYINIYINYIIIYYMWLTDPHSIYSIYLFQFITSNSFS